MAAIPPTPSRPSLQDKRQAFRRLHESGCFVLPNPWDIGSALFLQQLGFKALASTSAGFAWTQGCADGAARRERVLTHLAELVAATDVPVNADFERGFAADSAGVADSVQLAAVSGVAGLSIEDATGDPAHPLYELPVALERLTAARRAIDRSGGEVLLVARSEGFIVGRPDLAETIHRLQAYTNAGADCLYAPGLRSREQIAAVVQAVAPKPLNVLAGAPGSLSVSELAELGVRRISVGSALARAAWGGFLRAARQIAEQGRFDELAAAPSHRELNALFGR
jgi:2-methylisocitrate lyase-like PEP mutase family enzyme